MRTFATTIALLLLAGACGTPQRRPVEVEDDQLESETCCCRWTPIGADKGRPSYEEINRMECSERQGECMAASNCAGDQGSAL
ncbi:MAG: hypothetical protein R3B48_14285 [Kofleriaceae bacterium]